MRNIRQNLAFAFLYNSAGAPIAAGVLYSVWIGLDPEGSNNKRRRVVAWLLAVTALAAHASKLSRS